MEGLWGVTVGSRKGEEDNEQAALREKHRNTNGSSYNSHLFGNCTSYYIKMIEANHSTELPKLILHVHVHTHNTPGSRNTIMTDTYVELATCQALA